MKKYIALLLQLLSIQVALAQLPKSYVSFSSPAAAAMTLYNEMPVSKYNGTVGIKVPLYTLKENKKELPLFLSYNTSGVRPDQHPGPVGMNWSLVSGGSVTRIVKGLPDEDGFNFTRILPDISGNNTATYSIASGYVYNTNKLNNSSWNTTANITAIASNISLDYSKGNGFSEAEPDEYNFNIPGYSGKFFINADGTIRVQSNPNIKVNIYTTIQNDSATVSYNGFFSSRDYIFSQHVIISGMDITVEDGTKFIFGYVPGVSDNTALDAMEQSIDFFQQYYVGCTVNTWNISKMILPQNDTVNFYYYHNPYPIASFSRAISYQYSQTTNTSGGFLGWLFGSTGDTYKNFNTNQCRGHLIAPSYLATIVTDNTTIAFSYSRSNELTYDYNQIYNSLLYQGGSSFDPSIGTTNGYSNNPINIPPFAYKESSGRVMNLGARQWMYDYSLQQQQQTPYYDPTNSSVLKYVEPLSFDLLRWYKLDTIAVYTNASPNIPYKYFKFDYNNVPTERLKLLSVREGNSNFQELPPYRFIYDSSYTLPPYLSYNVDHWGFFSNKNSYISSFDATTLSNYYNLRQPDSLYLKAGMLSTIQYPGGGTSTFVYEPHTYNQVRYRDESTGNFYLQTESGYAGGLRIKQITFNAGAGTTPVTTNYTYESGILNGKARYYWPAYNSVTNQGRQYSIATFISESLMPGTSNNAGSYIGYSKVTEAVSGNGKKISYFSDLGTNPDQNFDNTLDQQKSVYLPFSEKSLERGSLLREEVYAQNNSLLEVDSLVYTTSNPSLVNLYAPAVESKQIVLSGFYGVNEFGIEGTAYRNYLYPYDLVAKIKTVYPPAGSGANPVTTSEQMTYGQGAYNLLVNHLAIDSKGNRRNVIVRYPQDYLPVNGTSTGYNILDTMITKHIINATVESVDSLYYSGQTTGVVTGAAVNLFKLGSLNTIVADKQYKLEITSPINNFQPLSVNAGINKDSRYNQVVGFDNYDVKGNILQFEKNYDATHSYMWDYNSTYPIAEVINAAQSDVAYTSFEADNTGTWFFLSGINGINVTDSTAPTGTKCYWIGAQGRLLYYLYKTNLNSGVTYTVSYWSKSGQYSISGSSNVKTGRSLNGWTYYEHLVSGVTEVDISGTGYIDEVRLYPSNAQMITYTYQPLKGITSKCDEKNQISYYNYDAFGRLKQIKDQDGKVLKFYDYQYQVPVTQ
ncbi:YD repeat-containing protein [Chitinophaga niastensis]|uniref:YD repeat-containing protein n=1 Tax=Chitinophaga niastensis TaxID=536980 RepID=A0A2P8H688_CHINA|nr:hypothetical protein [Chitinophaga niastensis]PSL41755.1 YD repeat-containing protein [Chitinophaga niastensis]